VFQKKLFFGLSALFTGDLARIPHRVSFGMHVAWIIVDKVIIPIPEGAYWERDN
jgi:hypothetical protein